MRHSKIQPFSGFQPDPLRADVYVHDSPRQDYEQFHGQYVWRVKIKVWRGPEGYYPRLGDPQFDCSFDIPAQWACEGWDDLPAETVSWELLQTTEGRQAAIAMVMNGRPHQSSRHLVSNAVKFGILTSSDLLRLEAT